MKTLILSFLTVAAYSLSITPIHASLLDIEGQPTINANAKIQVVAFLEPKCPDSKRYQISSFPKLEANYIKPGKISYTVVTTSFLSQSMPAATALLCVYNQDSKTPNSDLFFKFLNYIYQVQPPERQNWATTETLLKFATEASPEIDQSKLKTCIEAKHYQTQIEKNTAYGNKLMGHIHTPTIFVDGIQIENKEETIDYEKVKIAIEKALEKH